jgi:hypothetical protein
MITLPSGRFDLETTLDFIPIDSIEIMWIAAQEI